MGLMFFLYELHRVYMTVEGLGLCLSAGCSTCLACSGLRFLWTIDCGRACMYAGQGGGGQSVGRLHQWGRCAPSTSIIGSIPNPIAMLLPRGCGVRLLAWVGGGDKFAPWLCVGRGQTCYERCGWWPRAGGSSPPAFWPRSVDVLFVECHRAYIYFVGGGRSVGPLRRVVFMRVGPRACSGSCHSFDD